MIREQDILEQLAEPLCVIDRSFRMQFANARARAWPGVVPADAGALLWDWFPALRGSAAEGAIAAALADAAPRRIELPQADTGRWIELSVAAAGDGLSLLWRDIDERMGRDLTLQAQQERLRLAQEASVIGWWDWDLNTNEIHWSPEQYRLLGLDPDEAERRQLSLYECWVEALHPDDRETADRVAREAAARGQKFTSEFRIVRPDGIRWILGRGNVIENVQRGQRRMVGVNIDITERKQAEAELRQLNESLEQRVLERTHELMRANENFAAEAAERARAEAQREAAQRNLELALHAADLGIWTIDMRNRRVDRSERHDQMYGYPSQQEVWNWAMAVRYIPEDERAAYREAFRRSAETGIIDIEWRVRWPDGTLHWLAAKGRTEADEEGRPLRAVGVIMDVTTRRVAEEAAGQSQRMESIGHMTGGVAHDFNNLLAVIVGNLDMIELSADNPERVRKLAATALSAATRGERLTQSLLAFARQQTLQPEQASVSALVRDVLPLVHRAIGQAIELEPFLLDDVGVSTVDPAQFQSALLNLAVNARDAMPGGGRLRIETQRLDLDALQAPMHGLPPGRYAAIRVIDSGIGMRADVIARAFEPFFTTKDVGKGTGLGLSQVYGFARQSGGHVAIDSLPGCGTTVELLLPAIEGDAGTRDDAGPALPGPLPDVAGTILLVEDDPDVREVGIEILEQAGYAVIAAEDGHRASEILRGPQPLDLLFTDVVMPRGIGGVDLAREARACRPGLPVLLTSGYAHTSLDGDEGAIEFPLLVKPYRRQQLIEAVAAVLGSG